LRYNKNEEDKQCSREEKSGTFSPTTRRYHEYVFSNVKTLGRNDISLLTKLAFRFRIKGPKVPFLVAFDPLELALERGRIDLCPVKFNKV